MYLETGLGDQRKTRPKKHVLPQQRVPAIPPDRPTGLAEIKWLLSVPFRNDFEAFRREVERRKQLHVLKGSGPHVDTSHRKENDKWNEQRLKEIHDELLKQQPPLKENHIVIVRMHYHFIQGPEKYFFWVRID